MTDYFALLQQPRRPWLELEKLEAKYHELARSTHPDEARSEEGAAFVEINEAYRTLRDPKLRLQHLLTLENRPPSANASNVSPDLVQLFNEIAPAMQRSDRRQLESLLGRLRELFDETVEQLRGLDRNWSNGPIEQAEALYRRLAFLARWRDLLEERCFVAP